jgi:multidrug resistance efflux pump
MKRKRIIPLILVLALAAFAGYNYLTGQPLSLAATLSQIGLTESNDDSRLTASGYIEADQVQIVSQVGGRIKTLTVDKSDPVEAGQVLVELDPALLDTQTEQIEAQIALAEAKLARLEAGTPAQQIDIAAAAVELAQADAQAADQAQQDAVILRNNPQELDAQIDEARTQIDITTLQVNQTALIRDGVELREDITEQFWDKAQEGIDFSVTLPNGKKISGHRNFKEGDKQQASVEWNLATMDVWQAWVNFESANAAVESVQSQLDTLLYLRQDPLQADLHVSQAEAAYQAKNAAIEVANKNLDQLRAGPTEAQVAVLRAQVEQARSQLDTLSAQRDRFTLTAPLTGLVTQNAAHEGEVALPGTTLLTIADLNSVTLTVYVPDSQYGRLQVGQAVEVRVDSYPGRIFIGQISRISDEAEFTPKNIQTQEERVSLVYGIKITVPNGDSLLKPGMPADVIFINALGPAGH